MGAAHARHLTERPACAGRQTLATFERTPPGSDAWAAQESESDIKRAATTVAITLMLALSIFTNQASPASRTHVRPVQVRVTWLQGRLDLHQYICHHGAHANQRFHCLALTWTQRELQEATVEKRHRDTVITLNRGFLRDRKTFGGTSPMRGTGAALEAAASRWHVSPYLIAAIAATESSLGIAACSNNHFNAFGLSSCTSGWRVPAFRSWAEAYDFMGRFLTGHSTVTRGWPGARTPFDYSGYAACSDCWGRKVALFMRKLFDAPPEARYT